MKFFEEVYRVVRQIPVGKVTTYGEIADKLKIKNEKLKIDPRTVGWALHANRSPKVPCHRVVNKDGRLAPNFAFDGPKEQRRRLVAEGVTFRDATHVDLKKHLWQGEVWLRLRGPYRLGLR